MPDKDIRDLLEKYHTGQLAPAEKAAVEQWYLDHHEVDPAMADIDLEAAQQRSLHALHRHIRPVRTIWPRVAAAASIALLLSVGGYFYLKTSKPPAVVATSDIITPGKKSATLTLADGRKITLSDAEKGELAREAGVTISKTADGQILYEVKDAGNAAGKLNTLSTANGETYEVRLPDGTTVWLNAASAIKYPASFSSLPDRTIELTGEAFFKVAKDAAHPFIVKTAQQEVQVLGTEFNINSYEEEPGVRTTLIAGSIRVSGDGTAQVLKPGEQSLWQNGRLTVLPANRDEAIAWREGYFNFYDEDIKSIMRKISRWYDVEVIYRGKITKEGFNGAISRDKNMSSILALLESTGSVHFKVTGRTVTVTE